MISLLSALHHVAAQRGDGLHPDLIRLLRRSKTDAPVVERKAHRAAVGASTASEGIEARRTAEIGFE